MSSKLNSECSAGVPERVNHDQPGGHRVDDGGEDDNDNDDDGCLVVLPLMLVMSTRRALMPRRKTRLNKMSIKEEDKYNSKKQEEKENTQIPRRKTRSPPVRSCRHSNNKYSI